MDIKGIMVNEYFAWLEVIWLFTVKPLKFFLSFSTVHTGKKKEIIKILKKVE